MDMIDNKELHSALFDLEKELNELKTAKQQIEEVISIGSKVVKGFNGINSQVQDHLGELKSDYTSKLNILEKGLEHSNKEYNLLFENFKTQSESLYKELKHDYKSKLTHIDNTIGKFKEENLAMVTKVKGIATESIDREFKLNQEERKKFIKETETIISETISRFHESLSTVEETFTNQNKQLSIHIDKYTSLIEVVNGLVLKIELVNFPNRLDKLDNTVSAINIGIQNNQGKLDELDKTVRKTLEESNSKLEQNKSEIKDRIRDLESFTEKRIDQLKNDIQSEIQSQFEDQSKKMNLLTGLTIGCLILVFTSIVLAFTN
jgi:hypothetical protein